MRNDRQITRTKRAKPATASDKIAAVAIAEIQRLIDRDHAKIPRETLLGLQAIAAELAELQPGHVSAPVDPADSWIPDATWIRTETPTPDPVDPSTRRAFLRLLAAVDPTVTAWPETEAAWEAWHARALEHLGRLCEAPTPEAVNLCRLDRDPEAGS